MKTIRIICLTLLGFTICLPTFAQTATQEVPLPIARPAYVPTGNPSQPKLPPQIYQAACPVVLDGRAIGKIVTPIDDNGCGTQSPYKITAIKTPERVINLSSAITTNCSMVTALVEWVNALDTQIKATSQSSLTKINVGTSYTCRRRNNQSSGKISEHGFANALDLTGFDLKNGKKVKLPSAWTEKGIAQDLIKSAHRLACSHFTTVLGPEANALHQDHLHLDMGCHGKNCAYLICE